MTHRHTWAAVACMSVLLTARPAASQGLCLAKESILTCLDRLESLKTGVVAEAKAEAARAQAEVKKKTETGLQDINGLSSSVKDFLPLLQLSGLLGDLKKDESTGTVSVTINSRFLGAHGLTDDPSLQLKAVFETKPKLFDELRNRLPAATREAKTKALLESKTGAEHTTLYASYNVTSERLGRNFARHMKLYNDLVQEAVAPSVTSGITAQAALERRLIAVLGREISLGSTAWSDIPEAKRAVVTPIIMEVHQAEMALRTAFADAVKNTGLDLFGQLINNQPQLVISVSPAFRDDLFGPDVFSGRVAFEVGLSDNLNGFLDQLSSGCKDDTAKCLKAYAGYAGRPETRANIKAGSRLAIFAEFNRHSDYRFANTEAGLDLVIPSGTTWSAGVDYGTLFGVSETGSADGRVDGSLRFERRSDAPDEMRFVSSVVLTKKVGDISIPFGIVYANKPRFLTGVDKGVTATVGLKFSLFPGAK